MNILLRTREYSDSRIVLLSQLTLSHEKFDRRFELYRMKMFGQGNSFILMIDRFHHRKNRQRFVHIVLSQAQGKEEKNR